MKNTQDKRLASAAVIVMSSIILSRITGFLRTMLIPSKIGVNSIADAYNIAFLVPDLMYNLLVGGAIAAALIPILSGYIEKKQEEDGWKAVGTFINVIFVGMIFVCTLGIIFAPYIIPAVAPGFSNKDMETRLLAIRLTRILFPSVSFIMLAGLCNGVLNSYRRFAAAAYGPSIYNLGSALSIYIFGGSSPEHVEKVAYGVAFSAFIYFLFQLSFALRNLKYYRFKVYMKHEGFRRLFKLAIPSILSSSIVQVNVIISAGFVSMFKTGSYTAFKLADTAWQLPYGIFAQGIGIAMLPTLSAKLAIGEVDEFKSILSKGLKAVLYPSIPSAVGFIVLREPVVRAIFKWNDKFTDEKLMLTAGILMIFSVAMVTQSIVAIANRAFYANNDTKTPLYVGVSTIAINYLFSYIFFIKTSLEAAGMALSYTIISTINAIFLLLLLNRKMKGIHLNKLVVFLGKTVPAAAIMGVVLFLMESLPITLNTKVLQLVFLTFEIATGALIYFVITRMLKLEEADYILETIARKFKKILRRN